MVAFVGKFLASFLTLEVKERIVWWLLDTLVKSTKPQWDDELLAHIKDKVKDVQ